jgi:hypothetical protein
MSKETNQMNDQDLFNDEELYQDSESKNAVASIFGVVIRFIMAITTGGFFAVYAPALSAWLVGDAYAMWVSALLGIVSIDIMAWLYSYLRSNHASTTTQMKAAAGGTIGNIALSATVTAVFFILQTSFIPTSNADGSLTAVGEIINILGLIIGSLAMAGNGILWAWYQANGIKERAQLNANELRAASLTGRFVIEKQKQKLTMARTIEGIQQQLPALTATAGKQNATHYLQSKFGEMDQDGNGKVTQEEVNAWIKANPQEAQRFTQAIQEVRQPARPTPPQPTRAQANGTGGYNYPTNGSNGNGYSPE